MYDEELFGARPTTEDRLKTIIRLQKEFQESLGHDFSTMLGTPAMGDYFRTQAASLVFELGEASNELAWKPWASDTSRINHRAYRAELIDAFHFLINLMLLDDMSADEIYEGYLEKQAKNRLRQRDGYDGNSTKCPACRRDYNDAGVECRPRTKFRSGWCAVYGGVPVNHHPECPIGCCS